MATPQRTCIGCRRTTDRSALIRIVVNDRGAVVIDEHQRLPGRGAYLHQECITTALRRRAIPRALRAPDCDVSAVSELAAT